jgi:hypothetical protein
MLPFCSFAGQARKPWAGFARAESLPWWLQNGAAAAEVPAQRFAERSNRTRSLIWEAVPGGTIVRAILVASEGKQLLKVVTRPATAQELQRFGHNRMPVLQLPLFPLWSGPLEEHAALLQLDLFLEERSSSAH